MSLSLCLSVCLAVSLSLSLSLFLSLSRLKSQNFDFLTQKFKMAQNGSNSSQNGSNSKWLKLISNSSQKFKMAQNGSNSSQIIEWSSGGYITIHFRGLRGLRRAKNQNFDFLTQKFKMAV